MASEYTTNFNLDLYTDSDKPNLRDQYNSAMRKVDAQLAVNTGNTTAAFNLANSAKEIADKSAEDIANNKTAIEKNASDIAANKTAIGKNTFDIAANKTAIGKNTSDIAANKTAIGKNTSDIAANKTAIAKNTNAIANIDKNIFPITSDKIAAGAVTKDKLDAQAIESIVKGISIRYFDTEDSSADNEGMTISSNVKVGGFYVPEITLLVINKFSIAAGALAGTIFEGCGVKLPNYVPEITKENVTIGNVIAWGSDSFDDWTGLRLWNNGLIGVNSYVADKKYEMMGNSILFLRPFGVA